MSEWEETEKMAKNVDPGDKTGGFKHLTHETARKVADKLYDVSAHEREKEKAREQTELVPIDEGTYDV